MAAVNYKLINLLNSLTKNEIKEFKRFISSGFYTNGRNYRPLLNYLLKFQTKGLHNIKADDIYLELNPDKKFSDQTLKNRLSELYKLGEEFLIHLELKENKYERNKLLLNKLLDKKLLTSFEKKYNRIILHLDSEKHYKEKYQSILLFQELKIKYLETKPKINSLYSHIHENTHLKLCYYLMNLFEIGFEYNLQEYVNRKHEFNYLTDFLKKLDISELMNTFSKSDSVIYKITSMSYYLYKTFENSSDETYYFKAHKIFLEISDNLKDEYKIMIFSQLISYCIKKYNQNIKKFENELFRLYNEKLDQGLYKDFQKKIYISNNFRDYVLIAISLKKYKWAEDFVKKYSCELPKEFREEEINLSFAKLNIERNQFEKALINLNVIKTNQYLLYLDSSVLKLICYYDLGLFNEAYMELDRIKHYIRNNKKIPKIHFSPISLFLKTYQKLLKIADNSKKEDVGYLIPDPESKSFIIKRIWLLKKIAELSK